MSEKNLLSILFVAVVFSFPAVGNAAMDIEGFTTERHDRFANNPLFVADAFDLTGVARSTNGQWATMISPTHFLSADHRHPPVGSSVTFHHDNDPLGATSSRMVASGRQIGNTDLWIGNLDSAIDAAVKHYPLATDGLYSLVYHVGVSQSGQLGTSPTTSFAVGRNILDLEFGDVEVGPRLTDSVGYYDNSTAGDLTGSMQEGPSPAIADETFFQTGDSGAPTFVAVNGDLVLLGIHAFVAEVSTTAPDSTFERRASGDSYLPTYRNAVLTSIPEPNAAAYLSLLFCVFFVSKCIRHLLV